MQRATEGSLIMAATMAVIVWIIIAHNLWERRDDFKSRKWAVLYNDVAAQIVRVEVVASYIVLCPLVLLGAGVFVPGGYFQSIL